MTAIDDAIVSLPTDSPYRVVLKGIWSTDKDERRDGEQALMRVQSRPFDLVICDLKMPRVDGKTFYGMLVAAKPAMAERVVFVTGDVAGTEAEKFLELGLSREAFADKAGRIVGMAAETFNDGLRAYYFSFAAIGWFFSPLVFMVATLCVVYILYQREFRSDVLDVLNS
jgi:CheY-like chemotaxis protein